MKSIEDVNILVVGDIMLDKYIVGKVTRISPEAPVPVVEVSGEYTVLGGCGNVAANIKSIGAQVSVVSSIGSDLNGKIILDKMKNIDINDFTFIGSEITTCKERIVAGARQIQMLRVDREVIKPVDSNALIEFIDKIVFQYKKYDFIIISDYAKGIISKDLMNYLKTKNIKIIVDPKPSHSIYYENVFMLTPNEKEYFKLKASNESTLKSVEYTLVTKGREGMELYENGNPNPFVIPAEPVEVYNVAGAGDVVVSVISVAMACGFSPLEAAKISNLCAGYAVTKTGTCVITQTKYNEMVDKLKNLG